MGYKRPGHTAVHPGKRVLVVLRNGERFEDRFMGRTDRWVEFQGRGRVQKSEIRFLAKLNREWTRPPIGQQSRRPSVP